MTIYEWSKILIAKAISEKTGQDVSIIFFSKIGLSPTNSISLVLLKEYLPFVTIGFRRQLS